MSNMYALNNRAPLPPPRAEISAPRPGSVVKIDLGQTGTYPTKFTGRVEKLYDNFLLIRVQPGGYLTTLHLIDLSRLEVLKKCRS